jgi:hypothetical protein
MCVHLQAFHLKRERHPSVLPYFVLILLSTFAVYIPHANARTYLQAFQFKRDCRLSRTGRPAEGVCPHFAYTLRASSGEYFMSVYSCMHMCTIAYWRYMHAKAAYRRLTHTTNIVPPCVSKPVSVLLLAYSFRLVVMIEKK